MSKDLLAGGGLALSLTPINNTAHVTVTIDHAYSTSSLVISLDLLF